MIYGPPAVDFGTRGVTVNRLKVVTRFGTGQGITHLSLEYFDGTDWLPVETDIEWVWEYGDLTNEAKILDFTPVTALKLRHGANQKWGNFAINELELYHRRWPPGASEYSVRN